ncbi:MAG: hypothetical protein NWE89_14590 [Candidatus Bathyarchaeota archaeon]|nr:hypothetical protein [Candidatus Bathyarchaeota archaeon]
MVEVLTREHGISFFIGFLLGKAFGAVVSSYPVLALMFEDPSFAGFAWEEYVYQLFTFNYYHIALAIICGLILVVLRESERLEEA